MDKEGQGHSDNPRPTLCYDGCGQPVRVREEACPSCAAARLEALGDIEVPPSAARAVEDAAAVIWATHGKLQLG